MEPNVHFPIVLKNKSIGISTLCGIVLHIYNIIRSSFSHIFHIFFNMLKQFKVHKMHHIVYNLTLEFRTNGIIFY